jgi:hypothetical protein
MEIYIYGNAFVQSCLIVDVCCDFIRLSAVMSQYIRGFTLKAL